MPTPLLKLWVALKTGNFDWGETHANLSLHIERPNPPGAVVPLPHEPGFDLNRTKSTTWLIDVQSQHITVEDFQAPNQVRLFSDMSGDSPSWYGESVAILGIDQFNKVWPLALDARFDQWLGDQRIDESMADGSAHAKPQDQSVVVPTLAFEQMGCECPPPINWDQINRIAAAIERVGAMQRSAAKKAPRKPTPKKKSKKKSR